MKDTYSYKGWLVSDKLVKRSFAVIGHAALGWGIIILCYLFIYLIVDLAK